MIRSRIALYGLIFSTVWTLSLSTAAWAGFDSPSQEGPVAGPEGGLPASRNASLQSINEDYARQLLALERQRLGRLEQLAARQTPKEAAETYEELFHLAIANNLFREAESAAHQVFKAADSAPLMIQLLARTIDVIASADRGAYDESLADLHAVVDASSKRGQAPTNALDTPALLTLCDAYYQRLLHADRFDIAQKACELLLKDSQVPAVKGFAADRLKHLSTIGKPAPPIQGTDLDGKPVSLASLRGNVVLVVFWASWCLPSSDEVAALDHVFETYKDRGFRVLGINVDTLQGDHPKVETVLPNIRRFLLDNNVRWPNLINGTGASDYAKAYDIVDIPSNVIIGRDGTVIHRDLSPRKNLARVVMKAVGQ